MAFTRDPRDAELRRFNEANRNLPETAIGITEAERDELIARGQAAQDRRTAKVRRTIADLAREQNERCAAR